MSENYTMWSTNYLIKEKNENLIISYWWKHNVKFILELIVKSYLEFYFEIVKDWINLNVKSVFSMVVNKQTTPHHRHCYTGAMTRIWVV